MRSARGDGIDDVIARAFDGNPERRYQEPMVAARGKIVELAGPLSETQLP